MACGEHAESIRRFVRAVVPASVLSWQTELRPGWSERRVVSGTGRIYRTVRQPKLTRDATHALHDRAWCVRDDEQLCQLGADSSASAAIAALLAVL